jgi:hypothetical protein
LFRVLASKGASAIDAGVAPVVSAQLTELLGEDEPTLREYVMSQVRGGLPAGLSPVRRELALVLDDDAEELLVAVLGAAHAVASAA